MSRKTWNTGLPHSRIAQQSIQIHACIKGGAVQLLALRVIQAIPSRLFRHLEI